MSEREELSRKLLEENGLAGGPLGREDREDLRAIIESERRRDARVRNLMLLSWLVFIVLFVGTIATYFGVAGLATHTLDVGRGMANAIAILLFSGIPLSAIAFIVAVVLTVSWGLRLAFGPRDVEQRLRRIEAQLARLEASQSEGEGGGDAVS
ncbi:MAG: hypothetical protein ACOX9R_15000 [Armatimonadota bacterium]|jgi:hypothetical protein